MPTFAKWNKREYHHPWQAWKNSLEHKKDTIEGLHLTKGTGSKQAIHNQKLRPCIQRQPLELLLSSDQILHIDDGYCFFQKPRPYPVLCDNVL